MDICVARLSISAEILQRLQFILLGIEGLPQRCEESTEVPLYRKFSACIDVSGAEGTGSRAGKGV